ncbi:uncharacterized protein MPTK1_7g15610 [Marchantia polymorpha subsp. ruderalis]|nr:hypothetical protein MARPO_0111s0058 [Marchantia polymorpha]BBN17597.1 hypothetical protein Mp_7g15610 [Marchantia polymorpha subsp. ruderalis]|eukprot:PTQ31505.1 hypothetical protein MARPO_0111s0058 [Marchantia polymorpha]
MTTAGTMVVARPRVSRWMLLSCAAVLVLAHMASAASHSSSRKEGAAGGWSPREREWSEDESSGATGTEEVNRGESKSWLPGLKRLSDRIFQLAEEEQHWPVLKLTQVRTILGIIFGGIGAGLSSAGGLGGGGLFVPLFNLMLQFDPKTSAALSNFMILGGSIVNLFINLQQHHPVHKHKPVIDFDVLLLMQPNMLLGISVGVILNVVFPAWLITASLAVVLGYMTVHSFSGGAKRWKRETQQNLARRRALEAPPVAISSSTTSIEDEAAPKLGFRAGKDEGAHSDSLTKPLLEAEAGAGEEARPKLRLFPWNKILALIFVWLAFFSVQVLRGGKGGQSILGFEQCGLGYWLITASQLPLALIITAWTISQLRHATHGTPKSNERKSGDIHEVGYVLGPEAAVLFPSMALVAGVLGGMLGIGGGMIINPLLFTVGMLPQVTAATCASMVFFSSSMSVLQYWLMGRIPIHYAVIAGVLCAIFSWFGITIVHKLIDKYNRASLIVFSVASVMGVSAVLMCGFGGWDVWQQYEGGAYMGFHYPC